MAADLATNVRAALEKLAAALADAAELTVETRYKVVDPQNPNDLSNPTLAARTVIKLDGDHDAVIPVSATDTGGIAIEDRLLELHLRNVQAAIEYRQSMLNTLLDLFRRRGL